MTNLLLKLNTIILKFANEWKIKTDIYKGKFCY